MSSYILKPLIIIVCYYTYVFCLFAIIFHHPSITPSLLYLFIHLFVDFITKRAFRHI